jgi:hypothetical protein
MGLDELPGTALKFLEFRKLLSRANVISHPAMQPFVAECRPCPSVMAETFSVQLTAVANLALASSPSPSPPPALRSPAD